MGIRSFLGNKKFYFLPYRLTMHDGVTWLLVLSEGEVIDDKYAIFNSITYADVTTTAPISIVTKVLATVASAVTQQILIQPIVAAVEFDVETPTDWGDKDHLYPIDFDGEKFTFETLSDWAKWVVLSNDLVDDIGDDINQDEEDYAFLNNNNMLLVVESIWSDDDENRTFIEQRIQRIFEKFKEKEEILEEEIRFFSNYSSYCNDSGLRAFLRGKIIKQEGDSQFIANEFGIDNFFTLDNFNNLIIEKIRKEIDTGSANGDSYEFDKLNSGTEINIEIHNDDGTIEEISDIVYMPPVPKLNEHLLKLEPIGNILGFKSGPDLKEKINIYLDKQDNDIYRQLEQRAGLLNNQNKQGTKSIPYSELKVSELYDNPTKYETFLPFRYSENVNERKQDIYPDYLTIFYKPIDHKWFESGWKNIRETFGFIDANDYSGLYDAVIGQYIKFITELEGVVKNNKKRKNIGSYFESNAEQIYQYIMAWIVVHYENSIRYNLAKIVSETDTTDLENKTTDDALEQAKIMSDLDLQGLQGDVDDEELTEEEIEQRIQLYKQCALLLNIEDLKSDFNKGLKARRKDLDELHKDGFYNNRFYMVEDQNDQISVKNKLISASGKILKPFLDITPDIISALKPRLRFYKVYRDSRKKETVSYEFPFLGHTDSNRVASFKEGDIDRGDGVGIKSFDFSFDGETPATSQKYITANLSLYFQTFQDFVKERTSIRGRSDNSNETFRYVDLFVNTKHCPEDPNSASPLHYDADYYRLRVDVGWEIRNDDGFRQILDNRGINLDQFNAALENMNKTFYLTLIDHEINISETGTVNISANYAAYMESYLDQNNVLLSKEAKELQDLSVNKYEQEVKKGCSELDLGELRASINAIRVSSRRILHESLIEKLAKNNCLYSIQVESKDRKEFALQKFFKRKPTLKGRDTIKYQEFLEGAKDTSSTTELAEKIADSLESVRANYNFIMDSIASNQKASDMETINFFYLADLVYFLLDSLYDREGDQTSKEQLKIILSSFSMNIPFTGDQHINIGEIPVEIEVFTKWYKDEIVDKELDSMSFLEFIRRITFYLITTIFSDICIDEQQHKRLSFMTATINSIKDNNNGTMQNIMNENIKINKENANAIIDIYEYYNNGTLPLKAGSGGNTDPAKFVQYLIIYPHHRPDTHVGRAKALEDAKRGVHHLYIGSNKGILKNVSFSKSDIQYIREARMMAQGSNGLLQLSSLYRANIKMIGNTIFYPGMLLYLNPFGFGGLDFGLPHQGPGSNESPNLSNIMGIGGYQKVVKVSSTISDSGKFETDVECIFEHTGEPPRKDDSDQVPSSNQRSGTHQQNVRNITCAESDNDTGGSCNAAGVSKKLQDQLLSLNRDGTINLKDLKQ